MTRDRLPVIHPGAFLAETLGELALSQADFARRVGVSPTRILFGRALGQSPDYWLYLQSAYDLKVAETAIGRRLKRTESVTGR